MEPDKNPVVYFVRVEGRVDDSYCFAGRGDAADYQRIVGLCGATAYLEELPLNDHDAARRLILAELETAEHLGLHLDLLTER